MVELNRKIEQGEATRRELVAVARELFAERGYDAVSIEMVLQKTGVSRGALYHHFKSKGALFAAVLEAVEGDLAAALAGTAQGIADPVAALRAGCEAWLRFARDPAIRQIALIDAPAVVGWQRWREIDEQHGFGLLKRALQASGRVRQDLIDPFAHMLLAALAELALMVARSPDPAAAMPGAQAALDELLDRLLRT